MDTPDPAFTGMVTVFVGGKISTLPEEVVDPTKIKNIPTNAEVKGGAFVTIDGRGNVADYGVKGDDGFYGH